MAKCICTLQCHTQTGHSDPSDPAEPGDIPAARVNSTGGDSDTFSAAPGTTRHLMLPTHQQHASPNAQPRPQPQPAALLVPDPPAQAASPKRKTIALQPGALQIPDGGRKRRKLAKAVQADQGQTAQVPCHVTQRGRQQTLPLGHSPALPHLAKYGAPVTDATAVDFMEVQLARICNTQTPITAGLVSAVAHDICSAWQTRQCPLECIHTGFIAVLLDCAAAPPLKAAKPPESAKANPAAANHSHTTSPWTGATPGTPTCQAFGDSAFARLWCSETACQQHHFTWLIHCAVELDHLLSSPARPSPDQTHDRAGSKPSADSSMPSQISKGPGTAVKKRGRPPGSRNKKTLLRLQEEGLSPHSLPPAKAKQVPAAGLQHSSQQQPDQQANQQQSRATCLTPLPEGALLKALHRQALHYLGQACQVKSPGPFETEVCCLSAAAASFARLQGKVQVSSWPDLVRSHTAMQCHDHIMQAAFVKLRFANNLSALACATV